MDRLESAAWQLAGGASCAFVLAVVLKDADGWAGYAIVAVSVAGWSLAAPPVAAAALGLAGWLFVTGFDIGEDGALTLSGTPDLIRLGGLVGAGLAASLIGRWPAARSGRGPGGFPAGRHRSTGHPRLRDEDVPAGAVDGEPAGRVSGPDGPRHAVAAGTGTRRGGRR